MWPLRTGVVFLLLMGMEADGTSALPEVWLPPDLSSDRFDWIDCWSFLRFIMSLEDASWLALWPAKLIDYA